MALCHEVACEPLARGGRLALVGAGNASARGIRRRGLGTTRGSTSPGLVPFSAAVRSASWPVRWSSSSRSRAAPCWLRRRVRRPPAARCRRVSVGQPAGAPARVVQRNRPWSRHNAESRYPVRQEAVLMDLPWTYLKNRHNPTQVFGRFAPFHRLRFVPGRVQRGLSVRSVACIGQRRWGCRAW